MLRSADYYMLITIHISITIDNQFLINKEETKLITIGRLNLSYDRIQISYLNSIYLTKVRHEEYSHVWIG